MESNNPIKRIWELGKSEQSKLITAVILAVVGVICGMVPYFAAAKVITLLLAGERAVSAYTVWLTAALCGYLLRTVLYNGALSISHKATSLKVAFWILWCRRVALTSGVRRMNIFLWLGLFLKISAEK